MAKRTENLKKTEKRNKYDNSKAAGIIMMAAAVFLLLFIIFGDKLFGAAGSAVKNLLSGVFGAASVAVLLSLGIAGFFVMKRKNTVKPNKNVAAVFMILFSWLFILHIITSYTMLEGDLSSYIKLCYESGMSTAGGVICALICGLLCKGLTTVGTYVLLFIVMLSGVMILIDVKLPEKFKDRRKKKEEPSIYTEEIKKAPRRFTNELLIDKITSQTFSSGQKSNKKFMENGGGNTINYSDYNKGYNTRTGAVTSHDAIRKENPLLKSGEREKLAGAASGRTYDLFKNNTSAASSNEVKPGEARDIFQNPVKPKLPSKLTEAGLKFYNDTFKMSDEDNKDVVINENSKPLSNFEKPADNGIYGADKQETPPENFGNGVFSHRVEKFEDGSGLFEQKPDEVVLPEDKLTAGAVNGFSVAAPEENKMDASEETELFKKNEAEEKKEIKKPAVFKQEIQKKSESAPEEIKVREEAPAPPPKRIIKDYVKPPVFLLNDYPPIQTESQEVLDRKSEIITETFANFKLEAKVEEIIIGASVTIFGVAIPSGVPVSKYVQRQKDLTRALSSTQDIKVLAPLYGSELVGIQVPNKDVATIGLKQIFTSDEYMKKDYVLGVPLGMSLYGEPVVMDIEAMPHLLIAGSTKTGKSVCLNVIILSLVMRYGPEYMKLLLIDPKQVEFPVFNGLPHLLTKEAITDPKESIAALDWMIDEMKNRYTIMKNCCVRNIAEYNALSDEERGGLEKFKYIVVIVDEFGDLMDSSGKGPDSLETKINALARLSRAAGIHLIIATQRPSTDVITGTIKNNLTSRIAFAVGSDYDSRTILNDGGAETLQGKGDMFYVPQDSKGMKTRVQCAYVSGKEIKEIVKDIKANNESYFDESIPEYIKKKTAVQPEPSGEGAASSVGEGGGKGCDSLMKEAVEYAMSLGELSIGKLQRRFGLGFNRAARIVDNMEDMGIIAPNEGTGNKPRRVTITKDEFDRLFGEGENSEEL